jgi:TonB family protein
MFLFKYREYVTNRALSLHSNISFLSLQITFGQPHMKKLILLLTFISHHAFSQTVYQVNEVEKTAEPSGGVSMLNHFISSNMQIPILQASRGINSRVFVKGIVEPDGTMTGFEIVRGIDTIYNQEAIRIMSLYKAWKPALIKGAPVRQSIIYPLIFKIDKTIDFDSTLNAKIYYLDKDERPTDKPEDARNRIVIPVDLYGYVNQDVQYQTLKGEKWKTANTVAIKKNEEWVKTNEPNGPDSVAVTRISIPNTELNKPFQEVTLKKDGRLLSFTDFNSLGSPVLTKSFYLNGALKQTDEHRDGKVLRTRWFQKGTINLVTEFHEGPGENSGLVIKAVWDKDGLALVRDGNGWARIPSNSYQGQEVWEEGNVTNGRKSGKWVGKLKDSTLVYQEAYDAGSLLQGISFANGEKIDYNQEYQQPEFEGGLNGMYRFLAQNISYPVNAAKSRIMGKVVLTFVVCEDGSLCDYEVSKGVERSLDNEALRVVKRMSGKWKPGLMKGRKVRVKYHLPVNFQLQ